MKSFSSHWSSWCLIYDLFFCNYLRTEENKLWGWQKVSEFLATHCLLNNSCAWSVWFDLQKKKKEKKERKRKKKKLNQNKTPQKQQKTETALKPAGLKNSKLCGVHNPFLSFSSIMLYFFARTGWFLVYFCELHCAFLVSYASWLLMTNENNMNALLLH